MRWLSSSGVVGATFPPRVDKRVWFGRILMTQHQCYIIDVVSSIHRTRGALMTTRSEISFTSDGRVIRGWLEHGEGTNPLPLVVMAHGLGGVKEWLSDASSAIAEAGFACLAYDHPNFGSSDGEPRQHVDPVAQVRAYRDAISF